MEITESMIHGVIEEWSFSDGVIWGKIIFDRKERFPNGYYIHTSTLLAPSPSDLTEGTYIRTKNSFYRLGKPEGGENNASSILSTSNT